MNRAFRLAARRLRAALRLPNRAGWYATVLVTVLYLVAAWPLARAAGLISLAAPAPTAGELALLGVRVLLLPAMVEEVVFRVLPNPHPRERAGRSRVVLAGVLSLAAYVLLHPLGGLLLQLPTPFLEPAFLLLAALLGTACLLLYRFSGSLWSPVLLHWLVVVGWLSLGGRGLLPGA